MIDKDVFMQKPAVLLYNLQEGMPTVALKAVLTPTNAGWNSIELYRAISEEHRMVSRRG